MRHGPTRRDILTTFLGAPVALAAGCAAAIPPLPPGEIVGASETLGHRLRDQRPPRPDERAWKDVAVVIVGAGVAGLTAGWHLARSGFADFVVLELEPSAGGTARSALSPVTAHPWGAHYLPAPFEDNPDLLGLLEEMGVVEGREPTGEPVYAESVLCRDPHERVWHQGHWQEGLYPHAGADPEDESQYARFFRVIDHWVAWRDGRGRRAFAVPLARCSDDAEVTALDRITMSDWLDRQGFTSARLRWLVDYGCRDDYGSTPDQVSAWAGLFYFCARRRTPTGEAQPLLTWPEGNGRLVAHLGRAARDRFLPDHAVCEVAPREGGVDVVALVGETVRGFRAKRVIFAAPSFLARHLLSPWRENPPAHLSAFEYGSWMVANLHLDSRPPEGQVPLAWDNILHDSRGLGYVVATHQRGPDHGPTVWTYYYPLTGGDARAERARLLSLGRADWADLALADLERAHPTLRGLCGRLDVMRWGHAMIRPRPGFIWGRQRSAAGATFRSVHFAHSDLSGLALFEEAFAHGLRAAREVLADRPNWG